MGTVISWLTYPGVYIIKSMGLAGNVATMYEQVGYSIADVVAKAVFGVLIWAIAAGKWAVRMIQGSATWLARVQFSKFSPPSVQRRHLPLAGVWPGKFGRPILLERHWPVTIFQELYSIVLVGP